MEGAGVGPLWSKFLHLNFYIFTFLTFTAGALALLGSGKLAIISAKCCFVFAALLLLGCFVRILYKLNKTLLQR